VINKTIIDKGVSGKQAIENKKESNFVVEEKLLKPLDKPEGSFYGLVKTSSTIHSPVFDESFLEWKINSTSQSNVGRMILFEKNKIEYVWDLQPTNQPIQLSRGLN